MSHDSDRTPHAVKVEHVYDDGRLLRPGDPGYAKAAKARAHERAESGRIEEERRTEWQRQRDAAIRRERQKEYDRKTEKLASYRTLQAELNADLERMGKVLVEAPEGRKESIAQGIRRIEARLAGIDNHAQRVMVRMIEIEAELGLIELPTSAESVSA